ncbi:MAG: phage terminase small subunit P27 family [Brevundimonas mediterranea]|uniref:phage terminase small subunit P27 family n=1 Tax=Brevundimonas mediterranea TaxID=74329 RepID=UPI0040331CB7
MCLSYDEADRRVRAWPADHLGQGAGGGSEIKPDPRLATAGLHTAHFSDPESFFARRDVRLRRGDGLWPAPKYQMSPAKITRERKTTARPAPSKTPAKATLNQPKSLSPLGALVWKRVVVPASKNVTYTQADEGDLAAFCEAYANHQLATQEIVKNGLFSTGSQGQLIVSPAARIQEASARLMAAVGARLGLDPVSRSAIGNADDEEEDDAFAGLIVN